MKDVDVSKKLIQRSVDRIFSFVNILRITSKIFEFRNWLKKYHQIEKDETLFEGYKFFLITSLKCLIESITYDTSLGLEEDYTFFRAVFRGVPLQDIPNTCEKVIFIKNTWDLSKKIRKSKNWEEMQKALENLSGLFEVFEILYENFVQPAGTIDKENSLRIATGFNAYVFLNDTRRGYPRGFISSIIIKSSVSWGYLNKVFKGYVYSLQYLWFCLLGKDKFENSCIKDLHRASEIHLEGAEDVKRTGEEKEKLMRLREWFALDRFFERIREEIIRPTERKLKIILELEPLLTTTKKINESILAKLLSTGNAKVPEYFMKTDKISVKKQLDYHLLWYEVNVLDTQASVIFNGVPAFISTLIGSVQLNKYYGDSEKVLVRIFKHPIPGMERGHDYSFGILVKAFGSSGISDYSGWLIFFDCATDCSGLGGSLHAMANSIIKKFQEDGSVEAREIRVDKNVFKEYLAERSVSSVFDKLIIQTPLGEFERLGISEILQKTENYMNEVKGKFFEYVVYKWIVESGQYSDTKCDFWIDSEQIDCMGRKEDSIHIFECKLNLHVDELEKIVKQMEEKVEVIRGRNEKNNINVIPYVIVYSKVPPNRKSKLEENGINVLDDFENLVIKNDRIFNNSRKEILRILNFEIQEVV